MRSIDPSGRSRWFIYISWGVLQLACLAVLAVLLFYGARGRSKVRVRVREDLKMYIKNDDEANRLIGYQTRLAGCASLRFSSLPIRRVSSLPSLRSEIQTKGTDNRADDAKNLFLPLVLTHYQDRSQSWLGSGGMDNFDSFVAEIDGEIDSYTVCAVVGISVSLLCESVVFHLTFVTSSTLGICHVKG